MQKVDAKVKGTHYIGDSLSASDFIITVTMSDGSTKKNPAGWSADQLYLGSSSTVITVTYGGVSTTVTVNASERPTEAPTQAPSDGGNSGSGDSGSGGSGGSSEPVFDKNWSLEMGKEAFDILNAKRAEAGLATLTWSDDAFEVAYRRSQEIVNDYSHNGAPSNYDEVIVDGCALPEGAIDSWMGSEAHRDILMWPDQTIGAIAVTGGYWCGLLD